MTARSILALVLCGAPLGAQKAEPAKAPTAKPGLEPQIVALEKATWEALKRKDAKAYLALCLPSCLGVDSEGKVTRVQESIATWGELALEEVGMEEVQTVLHSPQLVQVHYKVTYKGSFQGKPFPHPVCRASALWMKVQGAWKNVCYQETPLATP